MIEIVMCEECGRRFPTNPEKHKYRQKYCPFCRTPYKKRILSRRPKKRE